MCGHVIWRAGGKVQDFDPELVTEFNELECFGEVVFEWIILVRAERVGIRQRKIIGNAGAEFAGVGARWIGFERHGVVGAEADGDFDFVSVGANALDDFAQNARAIGEGAAVFAGTGEGAEKFVQQITVAMLDVHKIRAAIARHSRRAHVAFDQFPDLSICENLAVALDVEFFIEDGMPIGDSRFEAFIVGPAEAAGMGQLKTDE